MTDTADLAIEKQLQRAKTTTKRANSAYLEMRTSELLVRGYTTAEIATDLGIKPSTAYKIVRRTTDQWRENASKSINEAKAKELAKLDQVEKAAWEAWENSKLSRRKSTIESDILKLKDSPALKTPRKTKAVEEDQNGDPRYLDMVLKCVDRRIRILGIDEMAGAIRSLEDGGADDELSKRLAQYRGALGEGTSVTRTALIVERTDTHHDRPAESVDSDRPTPPSGSILDVVGRVRESTG